MKTWGANLASALLVSLFLFRSTFAGNNFGDLFDARWTTSIYEHWYQVALGNSPISQVSFFWGSTGAMGNSDAFLANGFFHSLARLAGFGILDSWRFSNFCVDLILNLGLAALATLFLKRWYFRFAFVLFAGAGYVIATQLIHVQTFGYGLAFWVVYLVAKDLRNTSQKRSWSLATAIALLALMALSAWYGAYLLLLILAFTAVIAAVISPKKLWVQVTTLVSRLRNSSLISWLVLAPVIAAQAWLFLAIYKSNFGQKPRHFVSYLNYAPEVQDWANVSNGDGFWAFVSKTLGWYKHPSSFEAAEGFSLVLLAALCALLFTQLFRLIRSRATFSPLQSALLLSILATWIVITQWGGSHFSLYRIFWYHMPGASSIRCPMRVNIFLFAVLIGILLYVLEQWLAKPNSAMNKMQKTSAVVLILAVLLIDQSRTVRADWKDSQYLPTNLNAAVAALEESDCESFLLGTTQNVATTANLYQNDSKYEIDAVVLSTISGVPTVNGYSAFRPRSYPGGSGWIEANISLRLAWAKKHGERNICVVRENGVLEKH